MRFISKIHSVDLNFIQKKLKKIFKKILILNFAHDIEILAKLNKFNISVIELPVRWKHYGESKVNIFFNSIKIIYSIFIIKKKYKL